MQYYFQSASEWLRLAWESTPWARGGLLAVAIAAILLAVPAGKLMRSNPIIVGLLLAAFGAVLVFTLTPQVRMYGDGHSCLMTLTKPTRSDLVEPTDISMNTLMLFPVGVLLMWLRPFIAVLAALFIALVLPFAVEYIQYASPSLGRTCSFYDIATNELGLIVGAAIGLLVRIIYVAGRALVRAVNR